MGWKPSGVYGFRFTQSRLFRLISGIALASLLLLLAACAPPSADRQAIEALVAQRAKALTTRNLELYLSLISHAYQDKGKDYAAKQRELAATLRSLDRIDYRAWNRDVRIDGDKATVTADYDMRITVKGSPVELSGYETLTLRREAGGWKIVAGL